MNLWNLKFDAELTVVIFCFPWQFGMVTIVAIFLATAAGAAPLDGADDCIASSTMVRGKCRQRSSVPPLKKLWFISIDAVCDHSSSFSRHKDLDWNSGSGGKKPERWWLVMTNIIWHIIFLYSICRTRLLIKVLGPRLSSFNCFSFLASGDPWIISMKRFFRQSA